MKIVYNKFFPFGGYSTFNFFGILFTKKKELDNVSINHERIHTRQMQEMLYIFFYLWYGIEYLIIRFKHKSQGDAYDDVSFEEEAYANEENLTYLDIRKPYAWFKYIKANSNGL